MLNSLEISKDMKDFDENKRYIKDLEIKKDFIFFSVDKISFFRTFLSNFKNTRKWISDSKHLKRKHHCRKCGYIFCFECINYNIQIKIQFQKIDLVKELIKRYRGQFNENQKIVSLKLCQDCFEDLKQMMVGDESSYLQQQIEENIFEKFNLSNIEFNDSKGLNISYENKESTFTDLMNQKDQKIIRISEIDHKMKQKKLILDNSSFVKKKKEKHEMFLLKKIYKEFLMVEIENSIFENISLKSLYKSYVKFLGHSCQVVINNEDLDKIRFIECKNMNEKDMKNNFLRISPEDQKNLSKQDPNYFFGLHKFFLNRFVYELSSKIVNLNFENILYSDVSIENFINIIEIESEKDTFCSNNINLSNSLIFFCKNEIDLDKLYEFYENSFENIKNEIINKNMIKLKKRSSKLSNYKLNNNNNNEEEEIVRIAKNLKNRKDTLNKKERRTSIKDINFKRINNIDMLQNERHNFILEEENDKKNYFGFDFFDFWVNDEKKGNFHILEKEENSFAPSNKVIAKSNFLFSTESHNNQFLTKKRKLSAQHKNETIENLEIKEKNIQSVVFNTFQNRKEKNNSDKKTLNRRKSSKMNKKKSITLNKFRSTDYICDVEFDFSELIKNLEIQDPKILILENSFDFDHFSVKDPTNIQIQNTEAYLKGKNQTFYNFLKNKEEDNEYKKNRFVNNIPLEFLHEVQNSNKVIVCSVDKKIINLLKKTTINQKWKEKYTILDFVGKVKIKASQHKKFFIEIIPSSFGMEKINFFSIIIKLNSHLKKISNLFVDILKRIVPLYFHYFIRDKFIIPNNTLLFNNYSVSDDGSVQNINLNFLENFDNKFLKFIHKDIKISYFLTSPQTFSNTFEEFEMYLKKIMKFKDQIEDNFSKNTEFFIQKLLDLKNFNKKLSISNIVSVLKEFQMFSKLYEIQKFSFLGGLNLSKTNLLSKNCFLSSYVSSIYKKNDSRLDKTINNLLKLCKSNQNCDTCSMKIYNHSLYFLLQNKMIKINFCIYNRKNNKVHGKPLKNLIDFIDNPLDISMNYDYTIFLKDMKIKKNMISGFDICIACRKPLKKSLFNLGIDPNQKNGAISFLTFLLNISLQDSLYCSTCEIDMMQSFNFASKKFSENIKSSKIKYSNQKMKKKRKKEDLKTINNSNSNNSQLDQSFKKSFNSNKNDQKIELSSLNESQKNEKNLKSSFVQNKKKINSKNKLRKFSDITHLKKMRRFSVNKKEIPIKEKLNKYQEKRNLKEEKKNEEFKKLNKNIKELVFSNLINKKIIIQNKNALIFSTFAATVFKLSNVETMRSSSNISTNFLSSKISHILKILIVLNKKIFLLQSSIYFCFVCFHFLKNIIKFIKSDEKGCHVIINSSTNFQNKSKEFDNLNTSIDPIACKKTQNQAKEQFNKDNDLHLIIKNEEDIIFFNFIKNMNQNEIEQITKIFFELEKLKLEEASLKFDTKSQLLFDQSFSKILNKIFENNNLVNEKIHKIKFENPRFKNIQLFIIFIMKSSGIIQYLKSLFVLKDPQFWDKIIKNYNASVQKSDQRRNSRIKVNLTRNNKIEIIKNTNINFHDSDVNLFAIYLNKNFQNDDQNITKNKKKIIENYEEINFEIIPYSIFDISEEIIFDTNEKIFHETIMEIYLDSFKKINKERKNAKQAIGQLFYQGRDLNQLNMRLILDSENSFVDDFSKKTFDSSKKLKLRTRKFSCDKIICSHDKKLISDFYDPNIYLYLKQRDYPLYNKYENEFLPFKINRISFQRTLIDFLKQSSSFFDSSFDLIQNESINKNQTLKSNIIIDDETNLSESLKSKEFSFNYSANNMMVNESETNFIPKNVIEKNFKIKEYYKDEFQELRKLFGIPQNEFIHSLANAEFFNTTGGKSKSDFMITHDRKYVIKAINTKESRHFSQFAKDYINYIIEGINRNQISYLCLVFGAFKIKDNFYIIMENLKNFSSSDDSQIKTYDLKGSELNRFSAKVKESSTLNDTNFLIERNGEPLCIKGDELFFENLERDCFFLTKNYIIDYSLVVMLDLKTKQTNAKIIDYMRNYDFMKNFESQFKKIKSNKDPTIIKPEEYRKRFMKKIRSYFIVAE